MGLWWLSLHGALAETPILYEASEPEAALSVVMQRTGLPSDQLRPVAVSELLERPAVVLGEAVMRHCAGAPSTMTEVRAEIVRAQGVWGRDRAAGAAMDHLDLAIARLGCLDELAEPAPLSALFVLRGALSAESEPDIARAELRTALSLSPGLAWPAGYPEAGALLLEEVRADDAPHTLSVSPPGTLSGPWIDGKTLEEGGRLSLGAGLHLLQTATTAGIRSAWLVVGGDAQLVLPSSYRRPLLERMREPTGREQIGWLLAAGSPGFQAGYITAEGGLWLVARQGARLSIEELIPPAAPIVEEEPLRWWQRLLWWRS